MSDSFFAKTQLYYTRAERRAARRAVGSALITQGHSATEKAERSAYCSKSDTSDTDGEHVWCVQSLRSATRQAVD